MLFYTSLFFRKLTMKNNFSYFYLLLTFLFIEVSIQASQFKTPFAKGGEFSMHCYDENFYNKTNVDNQSSEQDQIDPSPQVKTPVRQNRRRSITFQNENESNNVIKDSDKTLKEKMDKELMAKVEAYRQSLKEKEIMEARIQAHNQQIQVNIQTQEDEAQALGYKSAYALNQCLYDQRLAKINDPLAFSIKKISFHSFKSI